MSFIDYLEANCSFVYVSGRSQISLEEDCPFCGGRDRMYIGVKKEVGICFKCSKGFDGVQFVAAREGVTRAQAHKLIGGSSDRYVHLEECEEEYLKEPELWFPPCVELDEISSDYMLNRGFIIDFCNYMGLMFCEQNVQTEDGKLHYTANRIIIPIKNRAGEIISWQGRDITGKSKIKYLFQPGFKGAENLFNIDRIVPGMPIIIVEGVMDAFGWIRAGYTNVIATFGKKISLQQLIMLCALKPSMVYMAWDGDAIFERANFYEKYGHLFPVRMVEMGEQDADELEMKQLHFLFENAVVYNWESKILAGLVRC